MPIIVEGLRIAGTDGRPVLDDVSCRIGEGELTLVVGRNGSGKSTFLDALAGLAAYEGAIVADGRPVRSGWGSVPNLDAIGRIGQVFQSPEKQLFAGTVRGEFRYSLRYLKLPRSEAERRTAEAMDRAGLPRPLLDGSPFRLSGGQKRRLALATTLSTEPEWLLLDEPTAGLDPAASAELIEALLARKRSARGGVVVATHDLDALLPAADRILMLAGGKLVASASADELAAAPGLWERAGLSRPTSVRLAEAMRGAGLPVPAAFMTAGQAAALLARGMRAGACGPAPGAAAEAAADPAQATRAGPAGTSEGRETPGPASAAADAGAAASSAAGWAEALDPRAKWLFYVCVSLGIIAQRDWTGFWIGAAVTAAVLMAAGVRWRSTVPVLRPYLAFAAVSTLVSGIGFGAGAGEYRLGPIGFSPGPASVTLLELLKVACVMVGGVALSAATTPFAMKSGLERALSPLRRLRFPVDAVSLTGSLLLRFIPVLRREAARFNRIARSRGKRVRRSGAIRLRDLPAMAVPLLLSLLAIASDLAAAIEARGYGRAGGRRTSGVALRMRRRDWAVAAGGVLLLAALLAFRARG
ncbi:ATP-binding cassette domain-containing protein [Paenibacillus flagellatus]|nr:ATP-binding cassette domain-containing protein [Paenibacillus flagellatus]